MKRQELNVKNNTLNVHKKTSHIKGNFDLNEIKLELKRNEVILKRNEVILNDLKNQLDILEKGVYFKIPHDHYDCNYDNDILIDNSAFID